VTYLLDTHVFIWMVSAPAKLSDTARDTILDTSAPLCLSVASLWEMQIKSNLGTLKLDLPLRAMWEAVSSTNAIQMLQIEASHIWQLDRIGDFHKDPFDRMFVAQAQVENMCIISNDPDIRRYDVETIW